MSEAVKVRCPQCKNVLRMPREWLEHSIRCQHCAKSFRAVLKSKTSIPLARAPANPSPLAKPLDNVAANATPISVASPIDGPPGGFAREPANEFSEIPISRPNMLQPKSNRALTLISALSLLAAAGIAFGLYQAGWLRGPSAGDSHSASGPDLGRLDPIAPRVGEPPKNDSPAVIRRFPRRLLFIGVHQYAYANPISPTPTALLMMRTMRDLAETKLRIDKDQVTILSDLTGNQDAPPPLKSTIEQTIEQFLTTSRSQDRIMLIFVGHAVEVDDQPYLVPIEGELTDKNSLIPLSWLYDRLAACPARQKVLIVDTCRMDAARGFERPSGGPMGGKLDSALATPPA